MSWTTSWSVPSIKLHAVWHGSSGCLLNVSCKCLFNLCSVSRERLESDSESEVFVRSCSRNSDSSIEHVCGEVFHWKWRLANVYLLRLNFNVEYFWKFSKLFLTIQISQQKFFDICMKKSFFGERFRKAVHARNINIKLGILVNFVQFQN